MHFTVELQWGAIHINIVGWLTTGLIGVIYSIYPQAGNSLMGKIHFWLYNIGLPVLLVGMLVIQLAVKGTFPPGLMAVLVIGEGFALFFSIIIFFINIFVNVKDTPTR